MEFLGFNFSIQNNKVVAKVKNQTRKRFKTKIKAMDKLYNNKVISYENYNQVIQSYKGHLGYGNSKYLFDYVVRKYRPFITDYGKKIMIKSYVNKGIIVVYSAIKNYSLQKDNEVFKKILSVKINNDIIRV